MAEGFLHRFLFKNNIFSTVVGFSRLLFLLTISPAFEKILMMLERTYICRPFSRGMGAVSCGWLSTDVDRPLEANMARSDTYETEKYYG